MTAIRCAPLLLLAIALSAGEAKPTGLDTRVSFELQDGRLEILATFLGAPTGLKIEIAPAVIQRGPRLSLKVMDMSARNALVWAAELTGTTWREEGARILISEPAGKRPTPVPDRVIASAMQKLLDRPTTFDFSQHDLVDVVGFLGRISGLAIIVSPRLAEAKPSVTLAVQAVAVSVALDRIVKAIGATWVVRNEAVFLDRVEAPARKP
jgi:hypothetical protein